MAEADQIDTQEVRRLAIREVAADNRRGQILGFLTALAALTAACVLGAHGHGTAAAIVGGATVVGLVTAFVAGRRDRGT